MTATSAANKTEKNPCSNKQKVVEKNNLTDVNGKKQTNGQIAWHSEKATATNRFNRPFPSCCEPHYESETNCKSFSHEN